MNMRILVAVLLLSTIGCDTPPARLTGLIPDESPEVILRVERQWQLGHSQPVSLTPDLPEVFFDYPTLGPMGGFGTIKFK